MYDYTKRLGWAKLRVGAIVTIGLLIFFFTVMSAGNVSQYFTPKAIIYGIFEDARGLRSGSIVRFSGVDIGAVKSLSFEPDRRIKVTIAVDRSVLKYLKKNSRANILTFGLLGDKYVEISPGTTEAESLKPGDTIAGETPAEFQNIIHTTEKSIGRLNNFIAKLEEIVDKIGKKNIEEGTVAKLLTDPTIYNNIKATTGELARVVERMETGGGTLGMLLKDDTLYADLSSSARDIKRFADTLQESQGTLSHLIKDPALYDSFLKASKSLDNFTRKLSSSKGTIDKLIEDKSLYNNLDSASARLSIVLERIEKREGLLGKLVKDDELAQEVKTTLKELNLLISDIRKNPKKYVHFTFF